MTTSQPSTGQPPAEYETKFADLWQRPMKSCAAMAAHASKRQMYRLVDTSGNSAIAVVHDDSRENTCFISFAQSLAQAGLPVPEIYAQSADKCIYLQQDLGPTTLMNLLEDSGKGAAMSYYRLAVDLLVRWQRAGIHAIDTSLCLEGACYDSAAIIRDITYFETWYVRTRGINYDADKIATDAHVLAARANSYKRGFLMHRDYQSRNLMVDERAAKLTIIDFQGAREGPLAYDLASLLNQSKANLSDLERTELLDHYMRQMPAGERGNDTEFRAEFWLFSLARKVQNLGAYGRFGLLGGQSYFTQSIPLALRDIEQLLASWPDDLAADSLRALLTECISDFRHQTV